MTVPPRGGELGLKNMARIDELSELRRLYRALSA
jgi:hypothetical protein